jgi:hypothetical protein
LRHRKVARLESFFFFLIGPFAKSLSCFSLIPVWVDLPGMLPGMLARQLGTHELLLFLGGGWHGVWLG